MKSVQLRKLMLCCLLVVSIVPILFSAMPNFQASATVVGNGHGSGGHGGSGGPTNPHTSGGSINPYFSSSWKTTTTTTTKSA